jgi:hypothetical protein
LHFSVPAIMAHACPGEKQLMGLSGLIWEQRTTGKSGRPESWVSALISPLLTPDEQRIPLNLFCSEGSRN